MGAALLSVLVFPLLGNVLGMILPYFALFPLSRNFLHRSNSLTGFRSPYKLSKSLLAFRPAPLDKIVTSKSFVERMSIGVGGDDGRRIVEVEEGLCGGK